MAIQDSDAFLVARSGTNYQTPATDIMAIEDTDLLVVNRGGTNYKVTGAEVKEYSSGGPARDWKLSVTGLPADTGFSQLAYNDGRFIGLIGLTIYYSDDDGLTWNLGRDLPAGVFGALTRAAGAGFLIGGTIPQGNFVSLPIYQSDDGVNNWALAASIQVGNFFAANGPMGAFYLPITPYGSPRVAFANTDGSTSAAVVVDSSLTGGLLSYLRVPYNQNYNTSLVSTLGGASNVAGYAFAGTVSTPTIGVGSSILGFDQAGAGNSLAGTSGTNSAFVLQANGNIVGALNSPSYSINTKIYITANPTTTVGLTTASPGIGTNAIRCGAWDSGKNVLVMAGTGGSITNSYDGGLTWKPSDLQYEIPGIAEETFIACQASPTCFILSSSKMVLRATI